MKTGYWFLTTCDVTEWKSPTSERFFMGDAESVARSNNCASWLCTQAEWLGLQRDLCACITPWALPLLNPCGISQLQPSVLGVGWDWKSRSHCSRSLPHLVLATLLLKSQRIVSSGWSPNYCIRYIIALLLPSTSSRQGLQIWYRKKYDCSCYHYIHVMISWPVWCEISCVYFGGPRVTTFIGAREQV